MKTAMAVTFFGIHLMRASSGFAQSDFLSDDYQIFGRKEPISLGAVFSALGASSILTNPANAAFVSDNRLNFGRAVSGMGDGTFISWMAPNLSISSSAQDVLRDDQPGLRHEKRLLHFTFALSSKDLGYGGEDSAVGVGLAIKRQADRLVEFGDETVAGGHSVSIDLGLLFKWRQLALEVVVVDLNTPKLSDSDLSYGRGFIVGGRVTTPAGLKIALQGIAGDGYAGSNFGLSFAAEQPFMDGRLIPRLQLTSFFAGSEASMQNISASVAYRLAPKHRLVSFLKDLEISYALSFLALPNNVGTHMVVVTKYF
ncbi:MAG: hypothetical protein ACE5IY_09910 [bacterium]